MTIDGRLIAERVSSEAPSHGVELRAPPQRVFEFRAPSFRFLPAKRRRGGILACWCCHREIAFPGFCCD